MESVLGKRIEHYRLKCGLTQQYTADCLGIGRMEYSDIENGATQVTGEQVGKLAKLFNVGTDTLIYGEDPYRHDLHHSLFNMQFAEIAADLSESFEGIFYVNMRDDSYVALKTRGAFYNIIQNISGQNFFRNSRKHLRSVILDDDFKLVEAFIRKDSLLETLKKGNITSTIFRLRVDEEEVYYRLRVSKSMYDNDHVLFAIENVSVFVLNEKIQNEKLQRDKSIIDAIASEYSSIYYVDLVNNSYEIYKLNTPDVPEQVTDEHTGLSFTDAFGKCVKEMVYESDQEEMLKAGSTFNILSVLKDRDSFSVVYRSKADGAKYCEMKVTRLGKEPMPTHVVIGFADSSAEKTREIEKAKNISVVLQLSDTFEAVYDVDIQTGRFVTYTDSDIFSGERFNRVIKSDDIFKGIAEAVDRVVYVEDRPLIRSFLTREYLQEELLRKPDFQMDFRLLIGGVPTWYHLKVVMNENSNGRTVIVGVFNIEAQRQNEFSHMSEVRKLTWEAQYDMLTGVRNKNAYLNYENEMDKMMKDSKEDFAVVICDINNLKKINDELGHEAGDRLIKNVSEMLCDVFEHSPVFRIGGDEFIAILKGRDFDQRHVLVESVRRTSMKNIGTDAPVTACGISERRDEDHDFSAVFSRADDDMYHNKQDLKSLQ